MYPPLLKNGRALSKTWYMNKLKILFVINSLGPGGAEKTLVNFLVSLKRTAPVDVTLIQINDTDTVKSSVAELGKNGISIINLNCSRFNPFIPLKLKKIIRRHKYQLVHVHLFPSLYWVAITDILFALDCKLIFTEHSTSNNRINKSVLRPVEKIVYNRYEKIIAISENVSGILNKWIGPLSKITTIYNGIELDKTKLHSDAYSNIEAGMPSNRKELLMVARLDRPKRHDLLIKSLLLLGPDYHLLIAGEGKKKEELVGLVNSLGLNNQVSFLGHINHVTQYMARAAINVLCSDYEGLSGVTLEAMRSGKPFIGSDVPGINDVVGTSSSLFANTEEAIANKVLMVFNDASYQEEIVKANEARIQFFSMEKMVARHIALYNEILYQ